MREKDADVMFLSRYFENRVYLRDFTANPIALRKAYC